MKRNYFILAAKWLLLIAIFAWGTFAFILLIGDENPEMPMTIWQFFALKVFAIFNLGCAAFVGWVCDKANALPNLDKYFKEDNYAKH